MPVLQTTGSCNFVFHSKKKGLGFYTPSTEVTCLPEGGNTLFFSGVPTGLSVHMWLCSIHLCTVLRIYSSSLLAKAPCVCVSFFPLSRSHLINLCLVKISSGRTNTTLQKWQCLQQCFARRPPSRARWHPPCSELVHWRKSSSPEKWHSQPNSVCLRYLMVLCFPLPGSCVLFCFLLSFFPSLWFCEVSCRGSLSTQRCSTPGLLAARCLFNVNFP